MRPKKHKTTGSNDLFRARLDQIINLKHELVLLAGKIDWDWIDGEIAPLYSENGRPGIETRFMIGLLLLKHTYGLSDEGVCERWVHDPYFQFFTGEYPGSIANALDTIATGLLSVAESSVTRPKLMVRPSRTTRASASTSDEETARMKCVVWSTVVIGR